MEYEIIRSSRKTLAAEIKNGRLIVRSPLRTTDRQIRQFLSEHEDWIRKNLAKSQALQQAAEANLLTPAQINALADKALQVIPKRVQYYAPIVGVSYGRITIRCQKTKWGSCSSQGNLNFNCLLMLAPPEVLDYVVIHELCHRKEMNHSARFYAEVARVCPDYKRAAAWLKEKGSTLMARVKH